MTHVTITIQQEGVDEFPIIRSMDYANKDEACADVQGILEFIANYVK